MLKKFRLWLEEMEKERRIRKLIMSRLFPNAEIDPSTVKIKGLHMLPKVIDELGIDDDNTVDELKNWALNNKGATLAEFLTQIDPDDVPDEDPAEQPGDPAQLPPEQQPPEQQPQGQPPPDAGAPPPGPDMGGPAPQGPDQAPPLSGQMPMRRKKPAF